MFSQQKLVSGFRVLLLVLFAPCRCHACKSLKPLPRYHGQRIFDICCLSRSIGRRDVHAMTLVLKQSPSRTVSNTGMSSLVTRYAFVVKEVNSMKS